MLEAILLRYDPPKGEKLDAAYLRRAEQIFEEGRTRALMYLRWLYAIDQQPYLEESIKLLEAIRLDSYNTKDQWADFFETLPGI